MKASAERNRVAEKYHGDASKLHGGQAEVHWMEAKVALTGLPGFEAPLEHPTPGCLVDVMEEVAEGRIPDMIRGRLDEDYCYEPLIEWARDEVAKRNPPS